MDYEHGLISGQAVPSSELRIERARALAQFLESNAHAYAQLVNILALDQGPVGDEAIVLDVEVERGQRVVHDIRRHERVAAIFTADDSEAPTVWALRPGFPREVSHLYLYEARLPPRLCIYEESWDDVRLHWTPLRFVERIRSWLSRTAAGALHAGDQPLPPFLLGTYSPVIMPPVDLISEPDGDAPYIFNVRMVDGGLGRAIYIMEPVDHGRSGQMSAGYLATVFHASPREHRSLQWRPSTLAELHDITAPAGMDLLGELRTRMRNWRANPDICEILEFPLMIFVVLPKLRSASDDTSEWPDVWVFATAAWIRDVGDRIDAWQIHGDQVGQPLVPDETKRGQEIDLEPLRPHWALFPALASLSSGIEPSSKPAVAAVGMGALGSQVFTNLMRMGWGAWTLIDEDYVLPHNLVRHALYGSALGRPKVDQLVSGARDTFPFSTRVCGIVVDVLHPGEQSEQLAEALHESELILDMAASVPVARHLARDVESRSRRVSLFLNPCGSDLVLLAEDSARSVALDSLEMQYYRALVLDPRLQGHLQRDVRPIRYAQSCRDVSAVLGQDSVALHAAIGSRTVRAVTDSEAAQIVIWRAQEDGGVERIEAQPHQTIEIERAPWRIVTDEGFNAKMAHVRTARLPNETGGVLLGAFDLERKIVYVADALPSPPDSVEWPILYIRGARGLGEQIEEVRGVTNRMLEYVGEWHSYPGKSCQPSDDDRTAFAWLSEAMDQEGLPALMLIVGEDEQGWHLGAMI